MSSVADSVSLAILAGGLGSRLGGVDKSRIMRNNVTQLERWVRAFDGKVSRIFVCNRTGEAVGIATSLVDDPAWAPMSGPIAGLSAAANAVQTQWLLTVPVDAVSLPDDLLDEMTARMATDIDVIRLVDQDGPQHLIALWRVESLRENLRDASDHDERAIWKLQQDHLTEVHRLEFHCGNLNTLQDLDAFNAAKPHESH